VFFVEVMGRHSGYIAIQCGIGGGAELVMVPETNTTIENVISVLEKGRDAQKTSAIIVVAEGGDQGNAHEIAAKVQSKLNELDIRVSTLGHIQRGGSPTAFDRILASRLGLAAVEGLLNGQTNAMVGIVDKKVQFTNFKVAISKAKPLDEDLIKLVQILSQ
jgi:6-phosphofructokinase 1